MDRTVPYISYISMRYLSTFTVSGTKRRQMHGMRTYRCSGTYGTVQSFRVPEECEYCWYYRIT
eukprot:jgi/Psemu1/303726/fgenesh1_kg.120_\